MKEGRACEQCSNQGCAPDGAQVYEESHIVYTYVLVVDPNKHDVSFFIVCAHGYIAKF